MSSRREPSISRVKAREKKILQRNEKSTAPQQTRQGPRSQSCKLWSQETKGSFPPAAVHLWVNPSALGQYQHCTVSLWETVTRIMAIDLLQAHIPVPAGHDALSSTHAILSMPLAAAQPCSAHMQGSTLAAGTPLPPPHLCGCCPAAPHSTHSLVCTAPKRLGEGFGGDLYNPSENGQGALLQPLRQEISWLR